MTHYIIASALVAYVGLVIWLLKQPKRTQEVEAPKLVPLQEYLYNAVELHKSYVTYPEKYVPQDPVEVTATLVNYNSTRLSECMTRSMALPLNPQFSPIKPEYKVWIYNVSRLGKAVHHPILGDVVIPGNTTKKRYAMYTSLPQPFMLPRYDTNANTTLMIPEDARRIAMDLINPDNLGLDQNFRCEGWACTGYDRDLGQQGLFWSLNNPPKKAEVDAAIERMAKRYKDLLERAEIGYQEQIITGKMVTNYMVKYECEIETAIACLKKECMRPSPEQHAAADYFKVITPWHPVLNA